MAYCSDVKRSIAKSITFRILVMIADGFIIFALTGQLALAAGIILLSNFSSTIIYYFHERVWDKVKWGKRKNGHKKKK